jgi:hypothetical protein
VRLRQKARLDPRPFLATKLDVNMQDAVTQKITKNALKYPVDKVKGSFKKYNQYDQTGE